MAYCGPVSHMTEGSVDTFSYNADNAGLCLHTISHNPRVVLTRFTRSSLIAVLTLSLSRTPPGIATSESISVDLRPQSARLVLLTT